MERGVQVAASRTRELAGEVNVVALGLVQLGIDKGDRVGIWAPNVPEWGPGPVRDGQDRRASW